MSIPQRINQDQTKTHRMYMRSNSSPQIKTELDVLTMLILSNCISSLRNSAIRIKLQLKNKKDVQQGDDSKNNTKKPFSDIEYKDFTTIDDILQDTNEVQCIVQDVENMLCTTETNHQESVQTVEHHNIDENENPTMKKSKNTFQLPDFLFSLRYCPKTNLANFPVSLNSYFVSLSSGNSISQSECMSNNLLRLSSFNNFPRHVNIFASLLTKAGFYYTGQSDEVRCFACGITRKNWITGDNPLEIHKRLSPSCSHILSLNNLDDMSDRSVHISSTPVENNQPHGNSIHNTERHNSTSVNTGATGYSTNASNEFPTNNITGQSLKENNENSKDSKGRFDVSSNQTPIASTSHEQTNNESNTTAEMSCSSNNANGFSSLGIDLEKPRYPNYAPLQVRISSFQGWPTYLDQTAQQMAKAGFLYAGYNDYTRCFFCGGGLRNWEAGDDPWVEHARWFPKCTFLRQNKGETFIKAVQDRQNQIDKEINENASEIVSTQTSTGALNLNYSTSNSVSRGNQSSSLHTVAAKSVLEMGYTKEQVLQAIGKIANKDIRAVSATDIMSVLLNDDENDPTGTRGESASASATSSVSVGQDITMPTALKDETVNVEITADISENNTPSFDDTELLFEENRQLKDQRLCKICLEFDANIAFLPCGHLVCCSDCAPAMRKCHICRAYVKGTVKTFLV